MSAHSLPLLSLSIIDELSNSFYEFIFVLERDSVGTALEHLDFASIFSDAFIHFIGVLNGGDGVFISNQDECLDSNLGDFIGPIDETIRSAGNIVFVDSIEVIYVISLL